MGEESGPLEMGRTNSNRSERSVHFDVEPTKDEPMKLVVRHTFLELEGQRADEHKPVTQERRRARSDTAVLYKYSGNEWIENDELAEEAETELGVEVATSSSPDSGLDHPRPALQMATSSDDTGMLLLPDCCLLNDPACAPDDSGEREVIELSGAAPAQDNTRTWTVPDEDFPYDVQTRNTPQTGKSAASMSARSPGIDTPLRTPGSRTYRKQRSQTEPVQRHAVDPYGMGGMPMPWPGAGQMPYQMAPPVPEASGDADAAARAAELELHAAQLKLAALRAEAAAQKARQGGDQSPQEAAAQSMPPPPPWMMYPQMYPHMYPQMAPFPQVPGMPPPAWPGAPPQWGGYPAPPQNWQMPGATAAAAPAEPSKNEKEWHQKPKAPPKSQAAPKAEQDYTTVMLRNVPNDYTRDMLLELLDANGFVGCYDFIYLPIDFKKQSGLGYAFLNMLTNDDAQRVRKVLQGFSQWNVPTQKVMEVGWSQPLQGLAANIERYRNSPVMHQDVPEHFKPLLFKNGQRVRFPPATRRLRPPAQ